MGAAQASYDVLILGAGPAGCATALGLSASGVKRVLLVDKPLALPFRIGESATPDVAGLLSGLGLEQRLDRMGHLPYHGNLSMWGSEVPRLDHFLRRGRGNGWHLDRAAFDSWLRQEAEAQGAQLAADSGIGSIAPRDGGWQVTLRDKRDVSARVVVDAAGRRSPLATRLGARRWQVDNLLALAAHTDSASDMAGLSLAESCADGWWYATGLPDGRALVTLMTDSDIAKAQRFDEPASFLRAWRNTRLLAAYLKPPSACPPINVFAAHSGFIERAAGKGWIAVGDALMGMDPLTSSGISGALSDARAAVPAILEQLDGNSGAACDYAKRANSTLKRYLNERRRHYSSERRWTNRPFWSRRVHHEKK